MLALLLFAFFTFQLFLCVLTVCWLVGAANMILKIIPRARPKI